MSCQGRLLVRGAANISSAGIPGSNGSTRLPMCTPRWRQPRHSLARIGQTLRAAAAPTEVEQQLENDAAASYSSFTLDSQMSWPSRSHGAGAVTEADVGKDITVCGWVDRNRNLGGLGFMDLRDHTGLLQVGWVWVVQSAPASTKAIVVFGLDKYRG